MNVLIEKIKDIKTAQNNECGILAIRRRRILPPEDLSSSFFSLPSDFSKWVTYEEDKLLYSDFEEVTARLKPGRDPEEEQDSYLKYFLQGLSLMSDEDRKWSTSRFLFEINNLQVIEELELRPIEITWEDIGRGAGMAKKSTAKLKKVEKELNRIEEYLQAESKRKTNPALSLNFATYPDGTVPNVLDRELSDWEIMKQDHQGVVEVSPIIEYEMRTGQTVCPESERIPWEVFSSWLSDQIK